MGKLRKIFMMVLIAAIVSLGIAGCKGKDEHPNKEHPSQKAPAEEHPTDGNKPGEHPK